MRNLILSGTVFLLMISIVSAGVINPYFNCSDDTSDYPATGNGAILWYDDFSEATGTDMNGKSFDIGAGTWTVTTAGCIVNNSRMQCRSGGDTPIISHTFTDIDYPFSLYTCTNLTAVGLGDDVMLTFRGNNDGAYGMRFRINDGASSDYTIEMENASSNNWKALSSHVINRKVCYRFAVTPGSPIKYDVYINGTQFVTDFHGYSYAYVDGLRYLNPRYADATVYYGEYLIINGTDLCTQEAVDADAPDMTFLSQFPSDITTSNSMGIFTNFTYNITDVTGIDTTSPTIYFTVNSTDDDSYIYINGTPTTGIQESKDYTNISENFSFYLDDNDIYPGSFNLEIEALEDTPHLEYSLDNDNDYFKVEIYNLSPTKNYTIIEVMVENVTGLSNSLRMYYCNSSYISGNPAVSDFCDNFYNLEASQGFNHSHGQYSSHIVAPLNIFDGMVGTVGATDISYFLMRGRPVNSWNISYISNDSRVNDSMFSDDSGSTWTDIPGTADFHIHQFDLTSKFWHFIGSCDTLGYCANTTIRNDTFDLDPLPPSAVSILSPVNGTYNDDINISYTESIGFNSSFVYYNITLLNLDYSVDSTITGNNSDSLNFTFDSTTVSSGDYRIMVTAIDIYGQTDSTVGEHIIIDNDDPLPVFTYPSSQNTTKHLIDDIFNFSISNTDNNLIWSVNNTCYVHNDSVSGIDAASYTYENSTTFTISQNVTCLYEVCDAHTIKEIGEFEIAKDLLNNEISFDGLALRSGEDVDDITYEKKIDRYNFCFDLKALPKSGWMSIYMPPGCERPQNSRYEGHYVCGNYWIDFEGYDTIRYSSYISIDVSNSKDTNICFDSIGKLNCLNVSYSFEIINDTSAPVVSNLTPANNTNRSDLSISFRWYVTDDHDSDINCTGWISGEQNYTNTRNSINATFTNFTQTLSDGYWYWNISCEDEYDNIGWSDNHILIINTTTGVSEINETFSYSECPDTQVEVLLIGLFFFLSLVLIIFGYVSRVGILMAFGGILLFICSWYIVSCIAIFGGILMMVSIYLIILSLLRAGQA